MKGTRQPGRPREFDPNDALAKATRVFWMHGYGHTTFHMLEEATQIHAQSLRYVFGDKRSLFLAVLEHYSETRVERIVACLKDRRPSPRAAIEKALDLWLEDAGRDGEKGCLMVNTSGELGREDAGIAKIIEDADRKLVKGFADAIRDGQESGDITDGTDPRSLARLVVTLGDGAMLHSRAQGSARSAKRAFAALKLLLSR